MKGTKLLFKNIDNYKAAKKFYG